MTSSLVSEDYGESSNDQDLPPSCLFGIRASSVHFLMDTDGVEGGFFVFSDLFAKREGRFRLRLRLFERDDSTFATPTFQNVSELITNVFTVFPKTLFPGMADTAPLTRKFHDQGVKIRICKPSRRVENGENLQM
jgi:hypothetical protein